MLKKHKFHALAIAASIVCIQAEHNAIASGCDITNILYSPGGVLPGSNSSGTFSVDSVTGQTCNLDDYIGVNQLNGYAYGHIDKVNVNNSTRAFGSYGNFIKLFSEETNTPTKNYTVLMSDRANTSAFEVLNNSTLYSSGNLFINSGVTRSYGLTVVPTGRVEVEGDLIIQKISGTDINYPYYLRNIINSGNIHVAGDYYSVLLENLGNYRTIKGGANVENTGVMNFDKNAYFYTQSGYSAIKNTGEINVTENLTLINPRVRNLPGETDTNTYNSAAISNQGNISAKNIQILTEGFEGISQSGLSSSIKSENLQIDTTLRSPDDIDTWNNNSHAFSISGGKALFSNASLKSNSSALNINGNSVAISIGDSNYQSLNDLSLTQDSSFVNIGEGAEITSLNSNTIVIADGVNSVLDINQGSILKSPINKNLIFDGNGNSILNIKNGAILNGNISLNDGKDSINLQGDINGVVDMGSGDDIVNIYGNLSRNNLIINAGPGTLDTLNVYGDIKGASTYLPNDDKGSEFLNFNLINIDSGSRFTLIGDTLSADNVKIMPNGRFDLSSTKNTAQITGNLFNSGNLGIYSSPSSIGRSLNITGNYDGTGVIEVGTSWYKSTEPNGTSYSDKLLISGNASGRTRVFAKNDIIGDIELKKFQQYSVPVIEVSGTTTSDNFWGNAQTSGAGEAQLVLRDGHKFVWQLDILEGTKGGGNEIISPDVPSYILAAYVNREMFRDSIATYRIRKGGENNSGYDFNQWGKNGVWGRLWNRNIKADGESRFDWKSRNTGYQFGVEVDNFSDGDKSIRTDIYASYIFANSKFYDQLRANSAIVIDDKYTGNMRSHSYNIGLTRTYIDERKFYKDFVIQFGGIRNKYESLRGINASNNGWSAIASFEHGFHYDLNESWYLEPMYQLMMNYISLKDFNDGYRNISQGKHWDGLIRLGGRIYYNKPFSDQKNNQLYLKANYVNNFSNPGKAEIGQSYVSEKNSKNWIELGLGFQFYNTKKSYLFMDAGINRSIDSAYKHSYNINFGINHKW